MKTLEQENAELKVTIAAMRMAEEMGTFHSNDVASAMVAKRLRFDPDLKTIEGHDGRSLRSILESLSILHPEIVRPAASGSKEATPGSSEGKYKLSDIFGRGSSGAKAQKLKTENPQEYARMREAAKKAQLI